MRKNREVTRKEKRKGNKMNESEKVYQFLDTCNYVYSVVEHEASFRVSDLVDIQEPDNSKGVKNLFLKDEKKQNFFLAVVPQDKRVDTKDIRRQIGSKPLSFADENFLWEYLKVKPGSVSPFGIINDTDQKVTVILDSQLFDYDFIGAHPNDNTKTVWISPHDVEHMILHLGNALHIIPVAEKVDKNNQRNN